MRVAIVTDWLVSYAGGERVVEQMLQVFPSADLYSVVDFFPDEDRKVFLNKKATTSFIQRLPFAKTKYRSYLPLMPLAIEQFDLSSYDLVISSSSSVAKGAITGPEQLHICYCHSPIRYAWDLQHQYLEESGWDKGVKSFLARYFLHKMRLWDLRTSNGVDYFIGNSHFIRRRIWKVYRRAAKVIYPPVDIKNFVAGKKKEDFYLTCSRMVPYKKIGLIVEAFSKMPEKRLVVIGDGPGFAKIRKAAGANVVLLGRQPFEVLLDHLQRARAFVFAALEDFGIAPVEAQACGTPVIAYQKGGVRESVLGMDSENPTGVFFQEQSASAIAEAICLFEKEEGKISSEACRENALRFSEENFKSRFSYFIESKIKKRFL